MSCPNEPAFACLGGRSAGQIIKGGTTAGDVLELDAYNGGGASLFVGANSVYTGNGFGLGVKDVSGDIGGIVAPSSFGTAANNYYELPMDLPTVDGQMLASTTGGVLSWASPTGGADCTTGSTLACLGGRAGGQTIIGGTSSGNTLTLQGTTTSTNSLMLVGSSQIYVRSYFGWADDTFNVSGFIAPQNYGTAADFYYELPTNKATTNGQVLSSTTDGILSWASPGGGADCTTGGPLLCLAGRSGGQVVYGGEATASEHLDLHANSATFALSNTGRIRIFDRIDLFPTGTYAWGGTGSARLITVPTTTTFNLTADKMPSAFAFGPTLNVSVEAPTGSKFFMVNPTIDMTVSQGGFHGINPFLHAPVYKADGAGVIVFHDPEGDFVDAPTFQDVNGGVFDNGTTYGSSSHYGYKATIATSGLAANEFPGWYGYQFGGYSGNAIQNAIGYGAIFNQSGGTYTAFNVADSATGGVRRGYVSDIALASGNRFLESTGDAISTILGDVTIGSNTAGSEKLNVAGNVLLSANAAELRLKGTGTGYTALKSPLTSTSSYTFTLPPDYGSASDILKTDGSGVLTWTTPEATKCLTIDTPVDADDVLWFKAQRGALTMVEGNCIVAAATSAIVALNSCDSAGANCSQLATATCSTSGVEYTSFAGDTVAEDRWVRAAVGTVTGTVGHVTVCVTYSGAA